MNEWPLAPRGPSTAGTNHDHAKRWIANSYLNTLTHMQAAEASACGPAAERPHERAVSRNLSTAGQLYNNSTTNRSNGAGSLWQTDV